MNKENYKNLNDDESYLNFTKNILEVEFGSIGETNWEVLKWRTKNSAKEFSIGK